jgi:hypothetical protein
MNVEAAHPRLPTIAASLEIDVVLTPAERSKYETA